MEFVLEGLHLTRRLAKDVDDGRRTAPRRRTTRRRGAATPLTRGRRYGRTATARGQGGPDPLAPPYDVRQALDALGDEVLAGGGLREALRDMLRRGLRRPARPRRPAGPRAADAPRGRAPRPARRRADPRPGPARPGAGRQKERARRPVSDDARFAEAQLDALPRSTARRRPGALRVPLAPARGRADLREILDVLRSDVLDQRFRGMEPALSGRRPGSRPMQRLKDMLADLNTLLDEPRAGRGHPRGLRRVHGQARRPVPRRPAERRRARRRARPPGRRRRAADGLAHPAAARGAGRAHAAGPRRPRPGRSDGRAGRQPARAAPRPRLGPRRTHARRGAARLRRGRRRPQELADLDDARSTSSARTTRAPRSTTSTWRRWSAPSAAAAADDVRRSSSSSASSSGRAGWSAARRALELSPKALRRLGQTALRRVFAHLRDGGRGDHDLRDAGAAGEPTGASRAWEFGDEQPLDVVRTVSNAVRRRPAGSERRRSRRRARRRGLRGGRDRAAGRRRRGALRRPVVLDGQRGPLGPDEADRPRAGTPRGDALPAGRPADHRLRPVRVAADRREARRRRARLRAGHEPAARPAPGPAAPAPPPRRRARRAGRHRRRADRAPRGRTEAYFEWPPTRATVRPRWRRSTR